MDKPRLTFKEAVKLFFIKNYANFSGRSRRSEFWWAQLAMAAVNIVLYTVCFVGLGSFIISIFAGKDNSSSLGLGSGLLGLGAAVLVAVVSLLTIVPSIAGKVRRLHDIGEKGWLVLIPVGINIVISIFSSMIESLSSNGEPNKTLLIIGGVLVLLAEAYLYYLYCKDSQRGFNKWGDSPKYPSAEPPSLNQRFGMLTESDFDL